ncbi:MULTISPECIES: Cro/CI family transcriptional regulator [Neisseria]|jgi:conserved domain protein|uniref:Cro/CI family transcriptional regulator n=1 Tax=Neisseria TaxID=482 RepID=UPI0008A44C50|nr:MULTISPECIES: Cro/CI family transcriptional regulator [Neisseria]MBS5835544.1 Cro/Cl family transcriptional regulator [Neisseria sp.]OFR12650.1 hypothetical protein HMPREF2907_10775 [Neisseria sp. HMSC055H02]
MLKSDVLQFFGSKTATAQALGISPSAVTQWKEIVPEKQAYRIEKLSDGELKVNPALYQKHD